MTAVVDVDRLLDLRLELDDDAWMHSALDTIEKHRRLVAAIGHRWTKLLTPAVWLLLHAPPVQGRTPVQPAVASFVELSLVLMGPRFWHDESQRQLAALMGVDRRRAGQLSAGAQKQGLIEVLVSRRGARGRTIPGPLLLQVLSSELRAEIDHRHRLDGIESAASQRGTSAASQRGTSPESAASQRGTPEKREEMEPENGGKPPGNERLTRTRIRGLIAEQEHLWPT